MQQRCNSTSVKWTFGTPPADVSKERLIVAWAAALHALVTEQGR